MSAKGHVGITEIEIKMSFTSETLSTQGQNIGIKETTNQITNAAITYNNINNI